MNIYAHDWERSTVRSVLISLSDGLQGLEPLCGHGIEPEAEQFEIDDALEVADSLWGIAFVTSQVYISSVVKGVAHIAPRQQDTSKPALLQLYSPVLDGTPISRLQLCDAAANYYKHHDEWGGWRRTERNCRTFDILTAAGFTTADAHHCLKASEMLFGASNGDCDALFQMITDWRDAVINHFV
jgi:hypothetical protein